MEQGLCLQLFSSRQGHPKEGVFDHLSGGHRPEAWGYVRSSQVSVNDYTFSEGKIITEIRWKVMLSYRGRYLGEHISVLTINWPSSYKVKSRGRHKI